ncbi:MAG TPA: aspartate aminotransferase family protein [Longimicrobiales bacterium]
MEEAFGEALARRVTEVPGPASRKLAARLARVESRNITRLEGEPPIFWVEARGANVRDADGNVYVDVSSGFGVAAAGHGNARVAEAVGRQAALLAHAMGDVYPAEIKVRLLERLAALAPDPLGVCVLGSAGSEAVEAALKTAILYTGRPGVIAFTGGYHGLTYGSLAATWRPEFRDPFRQQIFSGVRFAPYPYAYRWTEPGDPVDGSLTAVRRLVESAARTATPIGAVVVEPVQGRGGIVVPPPGFLPALRELCDEYGLVLVFDEVYTGFGRTGAWFACEHEAVVPDILTVGKALTGMLPLSAAIGSPEVMAAWPPSTGEAIHTSTFLGNPIACAAALAQIDEIASRGLVERAASLGRRLRERLEGWRERYRSVGDVRGVGLLQGVELVEAGPDRRPATERAGRVVRDALRAGVILLAEGPAANVLAFVPPLVITERQLDHAVDVVETALATAERGV